MTTIVLSSVKGFEMAISNRDLIIVLTEERNDLLQQLLDMQGYRFNSSAERRWERIESKIDKIEQKLESLTKHYYD